MRNFFFYEISQSRAVWQLAGLIILRSQVQILPLQPWSIRIMENILDCLSRDRSSILLCSANLPPQHNWKCSCLVSSLLGVRVPRLAPYECEYSTTVSISAFQAEDEGSIPFTHSKIIWTFSSVGQSVRLLSEGSQVQVLQGPPNMSEQASGLSPLTFYQVIVGSTPTLDTISHQLLSPVSTIKVQLVIIYYCKKRFIVDNWQTRNLEA